MSAVLSLYLRTFVLVTVFFATMAAAQIKYVAVVETEVDAQSGAAAKLNKAEVRQITTVLRNEARNDLSSDKYKIITTETVLSQGGAVLEKCADENCVVKLGETIGADYIVRGTVSKFGAKLTLSVEIYDIEDGAMIASSRVSSETADDLLEKAAAASAEMYKKFENTVNKTRKTPPKQPDPPPPQPEVAAPSAKTPAPAPAPANKQPGGNDAETLTDSRDGKTYRTVAIGRNRWTAENLNYQTGGSWCYDNDDANCGKYGKLYNLETARRVCPSGWHLPSLQEWNELRRAAGGDVMLKAKSGWSGAGNGTDNYGFSALPGGYRGNVRGYRNIGTSAHWYTSSAEIMGGAYVSIPESSNMGKFAKSEGFSVRCVQDTPRK
jgi:uncharacterized protein (TIGR02145 family)